MTIKAQAQCPTVKECQKWEDGCAEFVLMKEVETCSSDGMDKKVCKEEEYTLHTAQQSYGFEMGEEFESTPQAADRLSENESPDDLETTQQTSNPPVAPSLAIARSFVANNAEDISLSSSLSVVDKPDIGKLLFSFHYLLNSNCTLILLPG